MRLDTILVVGGAGYIGSHITRRLLASGYQVVVLDNLSRGHHQAIPKGVPFYQEDCGNAAFIKTMCHKEKITAAIHLAAYIEVGLSEKNPLEYYQNNVGQSLGLLAALSSAGVRKLLFSSTAAVYDPLAEQPLHETSGIAPSSVYGRTKRMVEQVIGDVAALGQVHYGVLRYFNACGADESGEIGEAHSPETHLIPLVLQVALGQRASISIFGEDYPTPDGTCVRDYIHVNDLADAHLLVLEKLLTTDENFTYNVGTGRGHSVREVIECCRAVTGHPIPALPSSRRPGDSPTLVANSSKLQRELGWLPRYDLESMIRTAWVWHSQNPQGYSQSPSLSSPKG